MATTDTELPTASSTLDNNQPGDRSTTDITVSADDCTQPTDTDGQVNSGDNDPDLKVEDNPVGASDVQQDSITKDGETSVQMKNGSALVENAPSHTVNHGTTDSITGSTNVVTETSISNSKSKDKIPHGKTSVSNQKDAITDQIHGTNSQSETDKVVTNSNEQEKTRNTSTGKVDKHIQSQERSTETPAVFDDLISGHCKFSQLPPLPKKVVRIFLSSTFTGKKYKFIFIQFSLTNSNRTCS